MLLSAANPPGGAAVPCDRPPLLPRPTSLPARRWVLKGRRSSGVEFRGDSLRKCSCLVSGGRLVARALDEEKQESVDASDEEKVW
ncbi:hypothetical protein MLD38_036402 [Melastoma candidum]|uniref:Uncharacterized protein n=1 Tax=Melastoma candidum TaxID=119954 RepID=A0ACB9LJL8_9MYRT|nr:hypothetical protein MLD38_036402 [Melastoma candidum]